MDIKFLLIISALTALLSSFNANALNISNVSHDELANGEVKFSFNLSDAANITVNIYDDRDYLIRQIPSGAMQKGDQHIIWNLKDEANILIPFEAYKYTISATGKDNEKVIHDLSDSTGNQTARVFNAKLNPTTHNVEFVLKKPSRVLVRAGLSGGGPLLVTLTNWQAKKAGLNAVQWNGFDASGVMNIREHKKLFLDVQSYSFSDNTMLVGKVVKHARFIDVTKWGIRKRETTKPTKKKMIAAYQQTAKTRGDFIVSLNIVGQEQTPVPIVDGIISVRLNVNKENMPTVVNRRAEPVFYVDGKFSYENEVGFYPMTWKLDTRNLNEGEHYLTVNLRGYEGNFGLASKKIMVKHRKDSPQ